MTMHDLEAILDPMIFEAIYWLCGGDYEAMWQVVYYPWSQEVIAIYERATLNGLFDPKEMAWGKVSLADVMVGL